MSDANRSKVSVVEEVTFNTTPATPAFEALRIRGAALGFSPQTEISQELVADRQVTDAIRTAIEAGGSIPMEFSYGATDWLMQAALYGTWVSAAMRYNDGTADSQITDVTATVFTVAANALDPRKNYGAFAVGHLVRSTGFTNVGNNTLFRASAASGTSVTGTGFTIEAAPPGTARLKVVGFEGAAADITITGTGPFFLNTAALNFNNLGVVAGTWLKIGGSAAGQKFATTANNDWVRVKTVVSATQLELDNTPNGFAADTGTGKTIQVWMGDYLRNGTMARSFSVEVHYQDLTDDEFDTYSGMRIDTFSLEAEAKRILNCEFAFQGGNATNDVNRFAGATDKSVDVIGAIPRTGNVLNASNNIGRIAIDGAVVAGPNYVRSVNVQIANGLRRQDSIGLQYSHGIGASRCQVTGTISTFYGSRALRAKLLSGTAFSFNMRLVDPNGTRAYVVDIPTAKYTGGDPQISGVDTDRILDLAFQGLKDPTLGFTIQIQRFEEFVA